MSWTIHWDDDGTLNIRAVLRPSLDPEEATKFVEAVHRHLNESNNLAIEASTSVIK